MLQYRRTHSFFFFCGADNYGKIWTANCGSMKYNTKTEVLINSSIIGVNFPSVFVYTTCAVKIN